jgi:acetylornithine deacetylase/succinyl-diaminopimelate desuccinylase family protein
VADVKNKILGILETRKNETVELLRTLIRTPSPSGQETEIARVIAETLRGLGFRDVAVDALSNVVCRVGGRAGKPALLYNGHTDVVPAGDISRWSVNPADAPIVNGKIIGRGACDMKGSIAAMIIAADSVRRAEIPLGGDLILTMVSREEGGLQEGTKHTIEAGGLRPDIALIGEATNLNLCLGSRGRIVVEVKVKGRLAHAANASRGVNAVVNMQKLIDAVGRMSLPTHEILGPTTQTITNITCSPGQINMVPDLCTITIDRRISPGDSLEKVKAEFQDVIDGLKRENPEFSAEVDTGKLAVPGYKPPDPEVLARLSNAAALVLGKRPLTTRYIFGTDGSYLSGTADIPWFGFGPGDEANAHTVNDHVKMEDLVTASKVYAMFILELLM